jgi:protein SCO1/2
MTFTLLLLLLADAPAPRLVFPDIVVTTQSGANVPFDDLVRGRVVAINFIFTSCTTVCPIMGTHFARVQSLLGDRAKDVLLVSVSIDPTTDTPERLAAWSKQMGGRDGWTLVTGPKPDMDRLLAALGTAVGEPASHTPVVLVGDDRSGTWERMDGLSEPRKLAAMLEELLKKRRSAR